MKDVNFILHNFPGRCGCRWSGEVVKNICPAAWAPKTFVQLISQNSPSSFCLCCPLIIIFVHTFLLTLKVMLQNLYRIKQEFFICINNYKQHRHAPLWQFDQLNKWTVPTMLSQSRWYVHLTDFNWFNLHAKKPRPKASQQTMEIVSEHISLVLIKIVNTKTCTPPLTMIKYLRCSVDAMASANKRNYHNRLEVLGQAPI